MKLPWTKEVVPEVVGVRGTTQDHTHQVGQGMAEIKV